MLVDYDGRVLAQAEPGPGDRIVVGPIDLAALRAERDRRRGHHLLAHLRTEAHPLARRPVFPAGRSAEGPISVETNEAAIRQARERLGRTTPDQASVRSVGLPTNRLTPS